MAGHEVVAQVDRRLPSTEYIEMTLLAHFLDAAQHKAPRSLSMLGIPVADVQQIDLHRLTRKGPDAGPIRTWSRRPHLKVALDLPAD